MEFQKIAILLRQPLMIKIYQDLLLKSGLKSMINQKKNYNPNKEIKMRTSRLRSDLCDYSDPHIVVRGIITVVRPNGAKRNTKFAFKNNAPFINCI